ncbi:DUF447 domain-containing protein [Haloglomus irregulare]|uniref:DUF447 domain-containing protein n=1 Tax=Haloglomus irregulare TaxID=2234134 RepID=A0A554N9L5_9EURY|nr:DUF447 domain-containing protein [Haloglomus irregulare]TSD14098.1 DUF447 domain-containing protein [Haloglomus irregulare]
MPDDPTADWPVALADRGVTETVVTTRGPNDRWNVAALGLHAPETDGAPATARTWGRTRTWRNFTERDGGYVQCWTDPIDFVEAACTVREEDAPVLDSAAAWARVQVEQLDSGTDGGTEWVDWALHPVESVVRNREVPTHSRARAAVVEATVAASRLGVPGFDDERLRARIDHYADVVDSCAGSRERAAWRRFDELVDRRPDRDGR